MGINYNDTADAEVFGGGQWFKPGLFKVQIVRCLERKARTGADLAIIEAKVLTSTSEEVNVGSVRSQVISFVHDSAHGNLKAFAKAAVASMHLQGILEGDVPDEDPSGEVIQSIMQDGLAVDTILNLECTNVKTKANRDFTKHNWEPCDG